MGGIKFLQKSILGEEKKTFKIVKVFRKELKFIISIEIY